MAETSSLSSAIPQDFYKVKEAGHLKPPLPLRIIYWNCRGLGNADTVRAVRCLCQANHPNCLFLMETKGNGVKFKRLGHKLGFHYENFVDAKGTTGGLALFWKNDCDLEVVWKSDQMICCDIMDLVMGRWCFMGCHGTPYLSDKGEL